MNAEQRAEYVERYARAVEAGGQSRISGRIFAHLATAEEPYLSLQELADQLGVSRASVSTQTRALIGLGMVTRVPVPGSRGEHYAVDVDGTQGMVARAAESARLLASLAAEGLALQPGAVTPGTQTLRKMTQVYAQLASSLEHVLAGKPARKRTTR